MPTNKPTPADQRSSSKNPQTPAGKATADNRANQMNPNNTKTKTTPTTKK